MGRRCAWAYVQYLVGYGWNATLLSRKGPASWVAYPRKWTVRFLRPWSCLSLYTSVSTQPRDVNVTDARHRDRWVS
jgi:hypothetical protein